VLAHGRLDGGEIVLPQSEKPVDLPRPGGRAMVQAMGEARCDEAAVAPGGTNGDLAGLDQEDVLAGVALLGLDCRPQAGEPAPDDE
jgi:hypothetical protein